MGPVGCPTPTPPDQGAVPYLRESCREGRRGSATIPGLNVLPLSPYPSIQLGLLPLASPWKKFRRKRGRGKKVNHAAEKRQPCSAGGSSEPGGPVHLRHGSPVSTPNPPHPRLAPPSPSIIRFPANVPAAPRPAAARPALRSSGFILAGGSEERQPRRPGRWPRDLGNQGYQGAVSVGRVFGSDLTATPHSPRWLRRSGQEDLRERLLSCPIQHPTQACRQTPASLCHQTTSPKPPPTPLGSFPHFRCLAGAED